MTVALYVNERLSSSEHRWIRQVSVETELWVSCDDNFTWRWRFYWRQNTL